MYSPPLDYLYPFRNELLHHLVNASPLVVLVTDRGMLYPERDDYATFVQVDLQVYLGLIVCIQQKLTGFFGVIFVLFDVNQRFANFSSPPKASPAERVRNRSRRRWLRASKTLRRRLRR